MVVVMMSKLYMNIPEDVIFEILLKVPPQYIWKLRYVCKTWHSIICAKGWGIVDRYLASYRRRNALGLIAAPKFQRVRFQQDSPTGEEVLTGALNVYTFSSDGGGVLDPLFSTTQLIGFFTRMHQSLHGLVWFLRNKQIHLCNPTTQEIVSLPKHQFCFDDYEYKLEYYGALGFDESTGEYKLLLVANNPECNKKLLHMPKVPLGRSRSVVCTLGSSNHCSNSWRAIKTSLDYMTYDFHAYANGVIYSLVFFSAEPTLLGLITTVGIVSFDVRSEEFKTLNLPQHYVGRSFNVDGDNVSLVELQGDLCLVHAVHEDDSDEELLNRIVVWRLKHQEQEDSRDGDGCRSWVLKFQVVLTEGIRVNIKLLKCIGHNKVLLYAFDLDEGACGFASYDIESQAFETIHPDFSSYTIYAYTNTLVSLANA